MTAQQPLAADQLPSASQRPPHVLCLNLSARAGGHTAQLLRAAAEALPAGAVFESLAELARLLAERPADAPAELERLAQAWRQADAILLGAPVYTFGPPAPWYLLFGALRAAPAQLLTPVGLIIQGGGEYAGAEVTAATLLQHLLALGALPVSGDMPDNSQGVIGQVTDAAGVPPAMEAQCRRLAARVLEVQRLLSAGGAVGRQPVRLLLALAGAAEDSQAQALADEVAAGAGPAASVERINLAGQAVAPCRACTQFCSHEMDCIYQDAMQPLRQASLWADAVAWIVDAGAPAYYALRAAVDRMNQMRFETFLALKQPHMARYLRAAGALVYAGEPAQIEEARRFFGHCALLYGDLPVRPAAVPQEARELGRRLARIAGTVRAGVPAAALPDEYYPSLSRFGVVDRARSRHSM